MLRLRELRESLGLTQKELGVQLRIDGHNIGDWERFKCEPSSEMLIKLANFFDCSIEYLLGADDDYGFSNVKPNATAINGKVLNGDEIELIENFRRLSPTEQDVIKLQTKALANKK